MKRARIPFVFTFVFFASLGLSSAAFSQSTAFTYQGSVNTGGVQYDRIGVVLINAVKEQQVQIELLKVEADSLKTAVELQTRTNIELRAEIDALKNLICAGESRAAICRNAAAKEPMK